MSAFRVSGFAAAAYPFAIFVRVRPMASHKSVQTGGPYAFATSEVSSACRLPAAPGVSGRSRVDYGCRRRSLTCPETVPCSAITAIARHRLYAPARTIGGAYT
jgi:hypothetical protein